MSTHTRTATFIDDKNRYCRTELEFEVKNKRTIWANAYTSSPALWGAGYPDEIDEDMLKIIPNGIERHMTKAESEFFFTQELPPRTFLAPQFWICTEDGRNIFIDFVLLDFNYRPLVCFEIDGDSHQGRILFDVVRDIEIKKHLGVDVIHISNAQALKEARRRN